MAKFKKGDKVRVTKTDQLNGSKVATGETYYVLSKCAAPYLGLRPDSQIDPYLFTLESYLELVDSKEKKNIAVEVLVTINGNEHKLDHATAKELKNLLAGVC